MKLFIVSICGLLAMASCVVCPAKSRAPGIPSTQPAYDAYTTAVASAQTQFSRDTLAAKRKYAEALDAAMKSAMKNSELAEANRLAEVKQQMDSEIAETDSIARRTIDLMTFIDPHRDAVVGEWRMEHGDLFSDATESARIEIPYEPPAEYDLVVDFTRESGNNDVDLIGYHARVQFWCVLAGLENSLAGLEWIHGQSSHDNPATSHASIENGRPSEAIVRVRNDGIEVYLDGKLVTQYRTDFTDMSNPQELHDSVALGVGSWRSPTVFHKIRLIEISGHGHEIK
jgi:hypothetical protein